MSLIDLKCFIGNNAMDKAQFADNQGHEGFFAGAEVYSREAGEGGDRGASGGAGVWKLVSPALNKQ
jgi:hypothetical protein